jgi:hypothetical protein
MKGVSWPAMWAKKPLRKFGRERISNRLENLTGCTNGTKFPKSVNGARIGR